MNLYDRIRSLADEKGVSIYRIEKDTGLSNGAISKWNKVVPNSANLMKVAKYLGITVEDLLVMTKNKKVNYSQLMKMFLTILYQ